MRYIGNKTRLLDFIGRVLDDLRIEGGRAFDAFSGTASVGAFLKRRHFAVSSCDLMTYSLVFQKAYIELDEVPSYTRILCEEPDLRLLRDQTAFARKLDEQFGLQGNLFDHLATERDGLHQVLIYLNHFLEPISSFVTRQYSQGERAEPNDRMFFSRANAERIDAVRTRIHKWRVAELLGDDEYFLLLACLLEAADAVANTTGVYAAFVKSWQSNALRPLRFSVPELVVRTALKCRAIQGDVSEVIAQVGELDLLYLDPPYNTRQYSSYYHVPELIAKGWFDGEPEVRGKTGLIADADKKSRWSTRRGCIAALQDLVTSAKTKHILMSYNSEGIIPESDIERIFTKFGNASTYRVFSLDYDRYRSDSDHEQRQYSADRVTEKLYYVAAR